jgi:hypothetical protein
MRSRAPRAPDAHRPVSRVLSDREIRMIISLDVMSPSRSSSQPAASWSRRTVSRRLFGLAPTGVYRATNVTVGAVGSYPTFSPLPTISGGRFVFCGTFRRNASLETIRPGVTWRSVHGARTFLGGKRTRSRRDHPVSVHLAQEI